MTIKELNEIQNQIKELRRKYDRLITILGDMKEYHIGTEDEYRDKENIIKEVKLEINRLENIII